MNTVNFHAYRANNLSSKWINNAIDAIQTLEGQINVSINTHDEGNLDIDLKGNWDDTLDHFESVLTDQMDEVIQDDEYHMLIIDRSDLGHGAGRTEGAFGPYGNASDSAGVVGGANAATRFLASCYGGQQVFKPTVMHEFSHAMMHPAVVDVDGNYDEHSKGGIEEKTFRNFVTPMQLWYTSAPCSGNSVPDDGNCTNNVNKSCAGTSTDLAACANNLINEYMRNI